MQLDHNKKLSCCGDEPCHQINEAYIQNSDWLLHEAFCLHSEADIFHPYGKTSFDSERCLSISSVFKYSKSSFVSH